MSNWTTTLASLLGAGLGGGGLVAVVNAFARRKVVRVDAADRLSDSALRWVEQFQEEAAEARREAAACRQESIEARREMHLVREEAKELAADLHRLRRAILDPNASLERLRAMVGPDGPGNGTV